MAFVNAGPEMVSKLLREIKGYVVCANLNSYDQPWYLAMLSPIDALLELQPLVVCRAADGCDGRSYQVYEACREHSVSPGKVVFPDNDDSRTANQSERCILSLRTQGLRQPMNEPDRYAR